MPDERHCPLCTSGDTALYCEDASRPYFYCGCCTLVFVPPEYYLERAAERAEYDLHQNNVDDAGYRAFLSRLAERLLERLGPASLGLDFGCGPGPALAALLVEAGHEVCLYDSFYHPDQSVLQNTYDFICATEVVEHLHAPGEELDRLWQLLRDGGWLGVMTKLVRDRQAFSTWHYKNDPTHVCFFSRRTWQWWAQRKHCAVEFSGADVMLLRKPVRRA